MMLPKINLRASLDVTRVSPLLNGMALALQFADEKGSIGLTASGAFNRTFVHWAAVHFQWPGYTVDELFRENKSLNEADMPPLWPIRDLACRLTFLVRKNSALFATDQGREFMKNPMSGFDRVASAYLNEHVEQTDPTDEVDKLSQSLPQLFRLIELEGDHGCTPLKLLRDLYPELASLSDVELTLKTWALRSELKYRYLRRLCWLGLLHEDREGRTVLQDGTYHKTPLWTACVHWQTESRKHPVLH